MYTQLVKCMQDDIIKSLAKYLFKAFLLRNVFTSMIAKHTIHPHLYCRVADCFFNDLCTLLTIVVKYAVNITPVHQW